MKFIIKLFPEITIKSPSVRLRFIKILASSIRNVLRRKVDSIAVIRHWDHIEVRIKENTPEKQKLISEELTRIPGIHHILEVKTTDYVDLHDIYEQTAEVFQNRIANKSFCVRVKRRGENHPFTSLDVERYVGGGLNQLVASAKVKLTQPDEIVNLEIDDAQLTLVTKRNEGIGGFPIGTQEDVLSLISGGFDSSVSSYMLLRRGCRVHYCFFNLGGAMHETGVKQVAYYLWDRFGRSHRVRFISVDFSPIVGEILEKVEEGQMGVILKRMMVRAASKLAERRGIQALVTGEALGQVSSQTLTNLRLIDNVSDTLILRPLISHDKETIIGQTRILGTEEMVSTMPEFCGVISKKPTVKAVKEKIEAEEQKFDFALLDEVVQGAVNIDIRQIGEEATEQVPQIEILDDISQEYTVIDVRSPDEQESTPLVLKDVTLLSIPFYRLASQFAGLDQSKTYLLYCPRGVMSRLQALYLLDQGYQNVKVYSPKISLK